MASKRPFSEVDGADKEPAPDNHSSNPRKRKRPDKKSKPKGDSINALKKRVRTIERRFKNGATLPPDVMAELQRELATSRAMIAEATLKKRRRDMISKYHMVRFFERRKAERLSKQLKRKAKEATGSDRQELQSQIHTAEVDLTYTRYFPFLEPYVSLYRGDAKDATSALEAERPAVWKEVEAAMEAGGAALENLRERNPEGGVVPLKLRDGGKAEDESRFAKGRDKDKKDRKGGKEKKGAKHTAARESEDDADEGSDSGGFFEE